eukprot:gene9754-2081_t
MEDKTKIKGAIGSFFFNKAKLYEEQNYTDLYNQQYFDYNQQFGDEPQKTLEDFEKEFQDSVDEQYDCKYHLLAAQICSQKCLSSAFHWRPKFVNPEEEVCYQKCYKKVKEIQIQTKINFEKYKDSFL